jgi:MADS-box transcription enhancer factor 2A
VALQTPIVPGLNSYSTFGAQDFSMTSDLNMITSWNSSHQSISSLQHNRLITYNCECKNLNSLTYDFHFSGIPHLAVSNSTPPPTSPSSAPVKIKAEPISPPRDQMLSQQQQQSLGSSSIIGITHSSATSSSLGSTINHSHMLNSRPSSTGHLTPTPGN